MARIILVALFVLAVAAQRAPLHSCTPHNPFLKFMSRHGMSVYSKPKMGIQMCGSEFTLHGTCCSPNKLKTRVENDRNVIQKATDKIILEFDIFMANTPKLLALAKSLVEVRNKIQQKFVAQRNAVIEKNDRRLQATRKSLEKAQRKRVARITASKVSCRPKQGSGNLQGTQGSKRARRVFVGSVRRSKSRVRGTLKKKATSNKSKKIKLRNVAKRSRKGKKANSKKGKTGKKISAELLDPAVVVGQLQTLISKLKRIHSDNQFTTDTRTCWNHISKIRASSLCSTCSGRSHEFFYKGKALMSQEVCVGVLDKCYKPLRQLALFVKVMNLVPAVIGFNSKISQLKQNAKESKGSLLQKLSDTMNASELSELAQLFAKAQFIRLIDQFELQSSLRGTEKFNPQLLYRAEKNLCTRFIVLNRAPIIVQVARLFAITAEAKTHTRDLLNKMNNSIGHAQKILDRKGYIDPNWRVLQMQIANAGKSLNADVAIVSMDNYSAYSGVGVSGHHAMDFSNTP